MGVAGIALSRRSPSAFECGGSPPLSDDFRPLSDVDLLVVFEPDAPWDLWDITALEDELQRLFGRKVDLVEKRAVTNPFRRYEILTTRQVLYAA